MAHIVRRARRFGNERVILGGSPVSAAGCVAILVYALTGGTSAAVVTALWVAVNGGFGLRGPAGFLLDRFGGRADRFATTRNA